MHALDNQSDVLMRCTAPTVVVYDNACNLQRYVLKRAPHFFRHTAFRIDRLHIFAHKGQVPVLSMVSTCVNESQHMSFSGAAVLQPDEYPAHMPVADGIGLKMLNTQVAEQVNSLLESIRTQVSIIVRNDVVTQIMVIPNSCPGSFAECRWLT